MKLRIRSAHGGSSTFKLEVPATYSLQALLDALTETLIAKGVPFSPPIRISLNKTEPIQGPGSARLSDLGIRSGDLLFYFERDPVVSPPTAVAMVTDSVSPSPLAYSRAGIMIAGGVSVQGDIAVKDEASSRRELCAAAAARRASSPLLESGHKKDAESSTPSALIKLPVVMEEPAHTSEEMQIDEPTVPHNLSAYVPDAGLSRASKSIPAILQRLLIAQEGSITRSTDLLIAAVHAVMLETGFIISDAMGDAHTLPNGWSGGCMVNLSYTLLEIRDATTVVGSVVLKFQTLGSNVVVYGTITTGQFRPLRLSLQTQNYINAPSKDDPISSFSDLFGLWKRVKDELSLPLLTALCERAGLPVPSSLLVLPTELKLKIMERLTAMELVKTGCTCSELKHLSENDDLWKRLFHEEFGTPSPAQQLPSFCGWKAAYAVRFLERKRALERRFHPHRPAYGISSRFRVPRLGGGIIGGDYDIYPHFGGGFGGSPVSRRWQLGAGPPSTSLQ